MSVECRSINHKRCDIYAPGPEEGYIRHTKDSCPKKIEVPQYSFLISDMTLIQNDISKVIILSPLLYCGMFGEIK